MWEEMWQHAFGCGILLTLNVKIIMLCSEIPTPFSNKDCENFVDRLEFYHANLLEDNQNLLLNTA